MYSPRLVGALFQLLRILKSIVTMEYSSHRKATRLGVWAIWALLISATAPAFAQDAATCISNLERAEELRLRGRFEDAIDLVNPCKDINQLSIRDRATVYDIMAKSYEGLQRQQEAIDAIKRLLELAPQFEPDPAANSRTYVQLFEQVREEQQNEPVPEPETVPPPAPVAPPIAQVPEADVKPRGKSRRGVLIGGAGALGVGAAVIFLVTSGEKGVDPPLPPTELPGPPYPGPAGQ